MQLALFMLSKAAECYDMKKVVVESDVEKALSELMPKLIFATTQTSSEIKSSNKLLKALDDKNLLDALLYL